MRHDASAHVETPCRLLQHVQDFRLQVPWSKGGAGDTDYLAAWELVLGPVAHAFAPQA